MSKRKSLPKGDLQIRSIFRKVNGSNHAVGHLREVLTHFRIIEEDLIANELTLPIILGRNLTIGKS